MVGGRDRDRDGASVRVGDRLEGKRMWIWMEGGVRLLSFNLGSTGRGEGESRKREPGETQGGEGEGKGRWLSIWEEEADRGGRTTTAFFRGRSTRWTWLVVIIYQPEE